MNIIEREVDKLIPYSKNAKKHDETQISNVAESIKQFGFVQPVVVDKNGVIVIGHCRTLAAKKLGMKTVPCVMVDELTDEQVRALRIIDNKTNESPWDMELLAEELPDIDLSGFDFDFDFGIDDEEEKTEIVEDETPEVEFSEILGEENNYLVLQFKTDIDWLNAQSIFGLETVKSYSTRKDGKVTKNMERKGVARVLDGAKVLNELLGDKI